MKDYSTKELFTQCRSDDVVHYLGSRGIGKEELFRLEDCAKAEYKDLEIRLLEGADILTDHGIRDFSGTMLLLVLYHSSWNPDDAIHFKKRIGHRLSTLFGEEAKYKSSKHNMHVSPIQILRERSGAYSGNLYEARYYWEGFVPSEDDFRRSVRIPVPLKNSSGYRLSETDAFVLGTIYAQGYLAKARKGDRLPVNLFIRGDRNDCEFFEDILTKRIQSTFNLQDRYFAEERLTRDQDGVYDLPTIRICSKAVATWLNRDLGFPQARTRNRNKRFPDTCISRHNYLAFMSGFVSMIANKNHERNSMRMLDHDIGFLQQAEEQLARAGIRCSRYFDGPSTPFLEVVSSCMPSLYARLDIRNPKLK